MSVGNSATRASLEPHKLWSFPKHTYAVTRFTSFQFHTRTHTRTRPSSQTHRFTQMEMQACLSQRTRPMPVQLDFGAKSECDTTYINWELPLCSSKLPLHKVTLEPMGCSIKQFYSSSVQNLLSTYLILTEHAQIFIQHTENGSLLWRWKLAMCAYQSTT